MTGWVTSLDELVAAGQRFGTIYIDPPWAYEHQGRHYAAKRNYPMITVDEIAALPVAQLGGRDAHLHLWTTTSFMFQAIELIGGWGFTYKSMLVWCKREIGVGSYWRIAHECLLLGVRGKATRFRVHNLRSWFVAAPGAHSRKPDVVRQWIEQASPGPYLELFGREAVDGWTVFGDERASLLITGATTQRRCLQCNEPFPAQRRTGKYCGTRCRVAAYRARCQGGDVTLSA